MGGVFLSVSTVFLALRVLIFSASGAAVVTLAAFGADLLVALLFIAIMIVSPRTG